MRQRCGNPKNSRYGNYGGRGIKICSRWNKFENFYADMGTRPSKSHSINRIDNDGDYRPDNCCWSTRSEQQKNKRPGDTKKLVRGDRHWTRKNRDKAVEVAKKNISLAHGSLEKNPNAKLTLKKAQQMKKIYNKSPMRMELLGEKFGVGRETARKVVRGLLWKS